MFLKLQKSQILQKAKGLFEDDEIVENELKQKLSLVPNMSILIDEVHHAASDDIKLRQVVSWWNEQNNITTVLGFSGTPYLKSAEKIYINESDFFKFSYITNTVYYYPLTTAIEKFLKLPAVKSANLEKIEILTQAINDFDKLYKTKVYQDETIAKCAIYCSSIKDLEEVVYPHLISKLKIPKDEILKFHKGNKEYKVDSNAEIEFKSLDLKASKKRYIGDSPKNMVLQTSCRCLREVDSDNNTALIWLNEANAKILNEQLKKEQNSSIELLNSLSRKTLNKPIKRVSRVDYLKLPKIDFYQLRIKYTTIDIEENANTKEKIEEIIKNIDNYKSNISTIRSGNFDNIEQTRDFIAKEYQKIGFKDFLFTIEKNSFMQISVKGYEKELKSIYEKIDNLDNVYHDIALCFYVKRELYSKKDIIKQNAQFLIVDNLKDIEDSKKLYPNTEAVKQILKADKNPNFITEFDKSFHYTPYDFRQSGFEKEILEKTFSLRLFQNSNLEIYYNGEKILILETKGSGFANDESFKAKKEFVTSEFIATNNEAFKYERFDFLYLEDSLSLEKNLKILNDKIEGFFNAD